MEHNLGMDPDTIQPLLKSLAETTHAVAADVIAVDDGVPLASWGRAVNAGVQGEALSEMRDTIRDVTSDVANREPDDAIAEALIPGFTLMAHGLWHKSFRGSLCIMRPDDQPWTENDRALLKMAADLCRSVMEAGNISRDHGRRLDLLVSYVASELMGVSAMDHSETTYRVLGELGRFFEVDTCYLRHNDPQLRASVLVDEWPRREDVPDPDPLGVISWDDPISAVTKDLREPYVVRPRGGPESYQARVEAGSGIHQASTAMVPLVSGDTTRGVLGFVHFGDRDWSRAEIRALQAIASLLVQLDARVTAEESLHHHAYHDELTGLPNRRSFVETLTDILKENPEAPLTVLFADMDRLKTVNDVLGHSIGDLFIQAVADRLRESVRPDDIVARLAGDEFVIVLRGVDNVEHAERIARRLLNHLTEPLDVGGHVVSRSACVGLAVNGGNSSAMEELLGNADVALLEAKKRGGNSVVSFNDDLRWRLLDRADLEFRLRTAIGEGEMRLFYQPEFDLRGGQITAVEALVRWQHPERGLLSADSFVSVVEEINLSAELGRWVLNEACRQLAEWKRSSIPAPDVVRVNISAGELISADFVGFVGTLLSRYGHKPQELGIEITESTVMRDIDDVLATLLGLRRLGVSIAIDDFGTGYSSLSHLKQLPVHTLKIDRSFVSTLAHDSGDRAIVSAIIRLAEAFNLSTVAEGVEDIDTVTALLQLGCERAQGYLMSKPVSAADITKRLAEPGDYLGSSWWMGRS
ncbi:putative bifunctional diguanylate cyclase/phosphodiesterase [Phytoactinopolyspora mesophila]|uniref:EAL domain-containing protein n=1 Tax=Phytoactinopolyspora mesophila TaxID=2650750 RepID=A0A7K3M1E1_9ACTN|nr:bifunctional diguanylate cyclase/phosphodiesterase [Phytoactinopolyspora mesophila]NDL56712.1 EAL domain-containing protein [Phytoactinopolyspora mesophila]